MTSDELQYVESARRHGVGTLEGDSALTNKAYAELMQALRALRQRPDMGSEFLSSLLDHGDPAVAAWAAVHLLPLKEREAISTLQKIAGAGLRLISFDAEMTLKEWNAGRLKVD